MNKLRFILIFFTLVTICQNKAQSFIAQNFDSKLFIAKSLLEKQPETNQISGILKDGYTLDSVNSSGYFIHFNDKNQLVGYYYKGTQRTVYVQFFEANKDKTKLYQHLIEVLGFQYTGSEHMCDYYFKGNISLQICPGLEKGIMIDIELSN